VRPAPLLAAALLLVGTGQSALAQESERLPFARARIEPGDALVSAPTTLTVEVLTPTYFRGAVRFPDTLPVDNAVVLLSTRGRANINERIDGASWAGIRRSYAVYPTRPGTIAIPAIAFEVIYGLPSGVASDPTPAATAPVAFEARIPPGMDPSRSFLAANSLSATQEVVSSRDQPRVGDTIDRRITLAVDDTPGLFLPLPDFAEVPGAQRYLGQPELSESGGARGSVRTATRTDTATYLLQQEGRIELPAVQVTWWNLSLRRLETESLPSIAYDVRPAPPPEPRFGGSEKSTEGPSAPAKDLPWWRVGALLAVLLLAAGPLLRRSRTRREPTIAEREVTAFAAVRDAARGGDARATEAAVLAWLDRRSPAGVTPTLAGLAEESGDAELGEALSQLERGLYGRETTASVPAGLLPALERSRRTTARAAATGGLPPLNP